MLNILVIHGYVQTAAIVAANTVRLRDELADIATLHYVDGPPMHDSSWSSSRPWWILSGNLEHNTRDNRWQQTVDWWAQELSTNQYDGVIGLSQGSAMTGLLVSMLAHPERAPGFNPAKIQPLKFAILCSGFVSHLSPHKDIYGIPDYLPTLHTVDERDFVVPAARTIELAGLAKNSQIRKHNEGHSIPTRGDWPKVFKAFIVDAVKSQQGQQVSQGLLTLQPQQ